jgi:hypothetical protein
VKRIGENTESREPTKGLWGDKEDWKKARGSEQDKTAHERGTEPGEIIGLTTNVFSDSKSVLTSNVDRSGGENGRLSSTGSDPRESRLHDPNFAMGRFE